MRNCTWRLAPTKRTSAAVPEEVKAEVTAQADDVLMSLRKQLKSKQAKKSPFSKPVAIDAHWTRNAFYFTVTYEARSPRSLEHRSNVARIEYNADGTFTLGFPMRRGWTKTLENAKLAECFGWISEGVLF